MAALPYIQLYVADYLADTAHLTAAQHGGYLLLLFNYWQRGKPLNNSNERLANVARMSNDEWLENKSAIAEFFEIDGDEWRHCRVDDDLAAVLAKSTKATAAGKASASKRASKAEQKGIECSTFAGRTLNHTDTDTDKEVNPLVPSLSADDAAEAKELNPKATTQLDCPSADIVALYHECMPNNPRCKLLTDVRKRLIRSRWKEASTLSVEPFGYSTRAEGMASWKAFFEVCADSLFLTGRAHTQPGKVPFLADIDFLMSSAGFTKCLENKYHREAA